MLRNIFSLALVLSTVPVSAETSDAEYARNFSSNESEQLARDVKEDLDLDQAIAEHLAQQGIPQVIEAQWGRWRCVAVSRRSGRRFIGVSQSRSQAERNALWRCRDRSRSSCFLPRRPCSR